MREKTGKLPVKVRRPPVRALTNCDHSQQSVGRYFGDAMWQMVLDRINRAQNPTGTSATYWWPGRLAWGEVMHIQNASSNNGNRVRQVLIGTGGPMPEELTRGVASSLKVFFLGYCHGLLQGLPENKDLLWVIKFLSDEVFLVRARALQQEKRREVAAVRAAEFRKKRAERRKKRGEELKEQKRLRELRKQLQEEY